MYDEHSAAKKLTFEDMSTLLCDDIKQGLYPTEKVLVESLERLNQTYPHDATVIWEIAPDARYSVVNLLAHPHRLIENRLQNIHFVNSDSWRQDYPRSLLSLVNGNSLLPRINRDAIIQQSGPHSWEKYYALLQKTTGKIIAQFEPLKGMIRTSRRGDAISTAHVYFSYTYAELADIEMLSHILASPHHRIVLFAGGFHCQNIAHFLETCAGYHMVHSAVNPYSHSSKRYPEISAQEIQRIAQDHGSRHVSRAGKSSLKKLEGATKPTISHPEKPQFSLQVKSPSDWRLAAGGALVLGGIMASAYYEHKRNPGVPFSIIAQRNLLNTITYGALPSALLYLWMHNQQAT